MELFLNKTDPAKRQAKLKQTKENQTAENQAKEKQTKEKQVTRNQAAETKSIFVKAKKPSRYIAVEVERSVLRRANHQCEFLSPLNNQRCESKTKLQMDHRIPFSVGGASDKENLRALCPTHNQLMAIQFFGVNKMKEYIQNLS